jgi:hypothetical protein
MQSLRELWHQEYLFALELSPDDYQSYPLASAAAHPRFAIEEE